MTLNQCERIALRIDTGLHDQISRDAITQGKKKSRVIRDILASHYAGQINIKIAGQVAPDPDAIKATIQGAVD
jgi:hypothetical protein